MPASASAAAIALNSIGIDLDWCCGDESAPATDTAATGEAVEFCCTFAAKLSAGGRALSGELRPDSGQREATTDGLASPAGGRLDSVPAASACVGHIGRSRPFGCSTLV
jgi:hypothetical protein